MEDYKIFSANIDQLHPMLIWIREQAAYREFAKAEMYKIELALEEVIVNIIRHAYKDRSGRIHLSVLPFTDRIEIIIKDKGIPFNPLVQEADTKEHEDLHQVEEGGIGLLLIQHCMDELYYQRWDSFNILTLKKYKKKKTQ